MYTSCIFCNGALGRNDALEQFPVGRRIVYDQARGRLWVVCRRCERWNLTPLEARWEAIEEAERLFRAARLRIATGNIALARLNEGLELVRVGTPPRLELAAWRYGDQFARRRRKRFALTGMGLSVSLLPMAGSLGIGAAVLASGAVLIHTAASFRATWRDSAVPTIFLRDNAGGILPLTERDTWSAKLAAAKSPGEWYLTVRHRAADASSRRPSWLLGMLLGIVPSDDGSSEPAVLEGDAARRALATLLPHANPAGASKRRIREAVETLGSTRTVDQLIYNASALGKASDVLTHSNPLTRLPTPVLLGLEMVLHEDDERRAIEGELAILEARWREAEEIAAIADSLLIPDDVEALLQALRRT